MKIENLKDLMICNKKLYTVTLSSDIVWKDLSLDYIAQLVETMSEVLFDLTKLSDKGYENNPNVNLPILLWFVKTYKIYHGKYTKTTFSVQTNILFLNLVLLLLFNIIILIEKHCTQNILDDGRLDLHTNITMLRKRILRMINPHIRDKISNKGLSVLLNTIVGFDSEYSLRSSSKMTNDLHSIQLAGRTNTFIKVPIVDTTSVNPMKINCLSKSGETVINKICCHSIDCFIKDIRELLYKENDELFKTLLNTLNLKDLKSETIGDYKVFVFPKSDVEKCIKYVDVYESRDLINDCDSLNNNNHEKSLYGVIELLNDIYDKKEISDKLLKSIKNSSNKPLSRITYRHEGLRLSITVNRQLYICAHESSADFSMLTDFDTFKENLDIVGRSFVTLGKPIVLEGFKSKVHIRDTILIAPAGVKSLAGLGNIYGDEFKKIDIGSYRSNMTQLLIDNKELFESYAIQDSIITLKHACSMEEFNFTVGKIGVPLTLSGIGKSYVIKEWSNTRYKGYQVRDDVILGNLPSVLTPKGTRSLGISNFIVPFIASYRGGRNESFMYGVDKLQDGQSWIDYDLTSCYTTVMSLLGDPVYSQAVRVFNKRVVEMSDRELMFNYIVLEVDFKFPKGTKYPCIPTRVDDDVDIYPMEGCSTITGCEYLVAKSMGCRLYVKNGVKIPFKGTKDLKSLEIINKEDIDYFGPYRRIVKDLQQKRRLHPKKTFYNYMYKEIGNSIYGQISMGISGKKAFDVKSKSHVPVLGGVLSNPILSTYITGFTRALIGECLSNIQQLKGNVVSVTTDGFITDVVDLENKILSLKNKNKSCLLLYKEIRQFLTTFKDSESDNRALEIKNIEQNGLISCKTRVQFGFTEGGISAATGFQTRNLEKSFMTNEFSRIVEEDSNKVIEYIQTGLRSAKDIYKHGGNVIAKYSDRSFSFEYDNKRRIKTKYNKLETCNLYDSVPWTFVKEYERIRVLKASISKPVFAKSYLVSQSKGYKSYIETSVRAFVKACLSENKNCRFGIPDDTFKGYKSIIDFVYNYEPAREVKLNLKRLSDLKNRNSISRTVPRTVENESFISYVKENIKGFEDDRFFKELSSESIRIKKNNNKK